MNLYADAFRFVSPLRVRARDSTSPGAIDDADGDLVDSKGQYQSLQGLLDGAVKPSPATQVLLTQLQAGESRLETVCNSLPIA